MLKEGNTIPLTRHPATGCFNSPSQNIRAPQYRRCVLYVKNGREHQSPWFYNHDRAKRALSILTSRYGAAVLYID